MGEMFPFIHVEDHEHFITEGFGDTPIGTISELIVTGSFDSTVIFGLLGSATLGCIFGCGTNSLAWHLDTICLLLGL
jgi:hypothetical protein